MKFAAYPFHPDLKQSIADAGFLRPTDIQFKAIPPILRGEDVLGIAQTGTGKTAAFVIPVIQLLLTTGRNELPKGIQCLVMVPTRELCLQITEVFKDLGKYTKIKTLSVFGGVSQDPQIELLTEGVHILVVTPGRLFDLISQGHIKLDQLRMLVVDEADHMLDLGFINDINQLVKMLPRNRQTLFFSATINPEIKKLAYSLVNNPIRIQISPKDPVSKNIDHAVAYISMDDKRFFLERLIKENAQSKILVFVRTKVRAERVNKALERAGIRSYTIHGDKVQQERIQVLRKFSLGEILVLIATDVSARGIDIPNVDYVVNYDLPEKVENYVHRIGRTGRGTHRGNAVSFCSEEEKPILDEITEFVGKKIKELDIKQSDYSETLDFSEVADHDWQSLIRENEDQPGPRKKKKFKKK
ncbi:MAG: DEAD/DEAH box helicase [Bacteroidales bacterium]|nr:DEAD/DEAH box helicase [Bacteroidales bacterium]